MCLSLTQPGDMKSMARSESSVGHRRHLVPAAVFQGDRLSCLSRIEGFLGTGTILGKWGWLVSLDCPNAGMAALSGPDVLTPPEGPYSVS